MSLNESTVEEAALSWFDELGYGIGHGPEIAPGERTGQASEGAFGKTLHPDIAGGRVVNYYCFMQKGQID